MNLGELREITKDLPDATNLVMIKTTYDDDYEIDWMVRIGIEEVSVKYDMVVSDKTDDEVYQDGESCDRQTVIVID